MARYIAALIDTVNKGNTLNELTKPAGKIQQMLNMYRSR